jgi:Flp pilus assembly protein CpaB
MIRPAVVAVLWCGFAVSFVRGDDPAPKGLQVPEGMRTVAVKVTQGLADTESILPGSRVAVIVTEEKGRDTVSRLLLQNVLVLAVDIPVPSDKEAVPGNPVVTVAVSKDDAEKLVLAAQKFEIRMVPRAPAGKKTK